MHVIFKQKNHIFYLIRISLINEIIQSSIFRKTKKLKKFEFVKIRYSVRSNRIVKNSKRMQKFGYGTFELFQKTINITIVRFGTVGF
jgi:hypothetical protein